MSLEEDMDDLVVDDPDLEWELSEGIPQFEDPFIQKYFAGRDALIVQEDKHRSGSSNLLLLSFLTISVRDLCLIPAFLPSFARS